jgi:beta-lactam-binding protein with PASTA domain
MHLQSQMLLRSREAKMTYEGVTLQMRGPSAAADEGCKPHPTQQRNRGRTAQGLDTIAVVVLLICLTACSKKVQVPDVKALTADKAGQVLSAAQLKLGKVTCKQGEVFPEAKILSQSPNAGESVTANTTVDLVVEDLIKVPKLVDSGATDALLALQNAGLKAALNKNIQFSHWGAVIQQDVAPGTLVSPATVITLTVATPPDLTMLQDVITKQPAYTKLSEKERTLMDQLFK